MKEEEETDQTKSPEKIGGGVGAGIRPISMHFFLGHAIEAKLHKKRATASWNVGLNASCLKSHLQPLKLICAPLLLLFFFPLPSICLQGEETFCHECRLWTTSQSLAIELHSAVKQISANSHSGISHDRVRSSKHPADPTQTLLTANSPLLLFFPCLKHDKKQDYS